MTSVLILGILKSWGNPPATAQNVWGGGVKIVRDDFKI